MLRMSRFFDLWDLLLVAAIAAMLAYASVFVENFMSIHNLWALIADASEKALLILPMTLLIVTREIDISIASSLALTSVIFGLAIQLGMPVPAAIVVTIFFGGLLGAFIGFLVSRLGLQSLVVTLGTMAMFRGIGYVLIGSDSINSFPESITDFGYQNIPGTVIAWTIVPFLLLAPLFAIVLQRTPTGKRIYVLGGNPEVARYSGINTQNMKLILFIITGVIAAIAGMVYTARFVNARADSAAGMELDIITIVLLGGVNVFGGSGKLTGVILALVLITIIRSILSFNQIGGDAQGMVIGSLLIGSLLIGNYLRSAMEQINRSRALREAKG